jgi:hypothetical protein
MALANVLMGISCFSTEMHLPSRRRAKGGYRVQSRGYGHHTWLDVGESAVAYLTVRANRRVSRIISAARFDIDVGHHEFRRHRSGKGGKHTRFDPAAKTSASTQMIPFSVFML